jgi:nucleotide-binding universal stress UspA family protein
MPSQSPVLVAIDFSPCSGAALVRARRIAAWLQAPLIALHVVTPVPPIVPSPFGPTISVLDLPSDENLAERARARWKEFSKGWTGNGGPLTIEVGSPRDRILETVQRERPRLLVIGAHGRFDAHRGIGTTAAACAQRAATQVLVVREGQAAPFRSVVACVDFGETSRAALDSAIGIATEEGASLHILHVYGDPWHGMGPPPDIGHNMPDFAEQYQKAVERTLREFCAPLAHELAAARPEYHAVQAPGPGRGILDFIAGHGCDLAVLGTRSTFNLRDWFWGSTAERVVRDAACSVLAIKPELMVKESARTAAPEAAAAPAGRDGSTQEKTHDRIASSGAVKPPVAPARA